MWQYLILDDLYLILTSLLLNLYFMSKMHLNLKQISIETYLNPFDTSSFFLFNLFIHLNLNF